MDLSNKAFTEDSMNTASNAEGELASQEYCFESAMGVDSYSMSHEGLSPMDAAKQDHSISANPESTSASSLSQSHDLNPSDSVNTESTSDQIRPHVIVARSVPFLHHVFSANVDFPTCESIQMSQQVDSKGKRTLAVVTKADKSPEGLLEKVAADNINISKTYEFDDFSDDKQMHGIARLAKILNAYAAALPNNILTKEAAFLLEVCNGVHSLSIAEINTNDMEVYGKATGSGIGKDFTTGVKMPGLNSTNKADPTQRSQAARRNVIEGWDPKFVGPFYKGLLEDGELIAIKEFSRTSTQGSVEMKNGVIIEVLRDNCLRTTESFLVDSSALKNYFSILSACAHTGQIDEGRHFFNSMKNNHNFDPSEEHYSCMINLLSCADKFAEVDQLIRTMPFDPGVIGWAALLGGCRTHGNLELRARAAEKLLELNPSNASAYVMLANMYASSGNWEEMANSRRLMRDQGVRKRHGCSWIEIGKRIHVLVVDVSHSRIKDVCEFLEEISEKMMLATYVPDVKWSLVRNDFREGDVDVHIRTTLIDNIFLTGCANSRRCKIFDPGGLIIIYISLYITRLDGVELFEARGV